MSLAIAVKNALVAAQEAFPEVELISVGFDYKISNHKTVAFISIAKTECNTLGACTAVYNTTPVYISVIRAVEKEDPAITQTECNNTAAKIVTALKENSRLISEQYPDGFLISGKVILQEEGEDAPVGGHAKINVITFLAEYWS